MTSATIQPGRARVLLRSRGATATLFAAACLAFLLPFGTVSCGEPVTFTGLELATAGVHGDDPDLAAETNSSLAPTLAMGALLIAAFGIVLAGLGTRGQGWLAAAALLLLSLLPWIAAAGLADCQGRAGFWLACSSLAAVVAIRARALLEARRRRGARIWPAVTGLGLLAAVVSLGLLAALPQDETADANAQRPPLVASS